MANWPQLFGTGQLPEYVVGLVDPIRRQVTEETFDHGLRHDREHLPRTGDAQWPEAGALAVQHDDGPHPFVPPSAVGTVEEVGVVVPYSSVLIRLVITVAGGLGMVEPAGTNAMVMS